MIRTLNLVVCLVALVCTGGAYAQTPDAQTDENAVEAPDTAPVAHVYVSTTSGTNLYDAAANGEISIVSGSPFKTVGEIIGSNGKFFITLGTGLIHNYPIAANGAIESQASANNTQDYSGANCGGTDGAVLDHKGQNVYVLLDTSGNCAAYQTYAIGGSGGLPYLSSSVNNDVTTSDCCTLPAITANDEFAYTSEQYAYCDGCSPVWAEFKRESNGDLVSFAGKVSGPTPQSSDLVFLPHLIASDPGNHLGVYGAWYNTSELQFTGSVGLASFTVASNGNLSSTNTWKNIPSTVVSDGQLHDIRMSPSGKLLALAGATGLEVYHFNGASPMTTDKVLTTVPIDHIKWDNNNHLYALSDAATMFENSKSELFVYTVTPTSITQVSGSPFHITGANGLVVIPK
jgi:hypothetical protein